MPQLWVIRRVFSSDNRWTWGIGLFRDLERDDEVVVGGGDGGGAGGGGAQEETRGNLRTILLQVNSRIRLMMIMVTGQIIENGILRQNLNKQEKILREKLHKSNFCHSISLIFGRTE